MKPKKTLAIADDHNLFRKGLISILRGYREFNIVTEAENGKELLAHISKKQPQVIILDLQMPVMDGIETLSRLKQKYPHIKIILLIEKADEKLVYQLMEMGANAILHKNTDIEILVDAIYSVADKGYYFNELVNKAMVNGLVAGKKIAPLQVNALSAREIDVIKLICKQKTIKEIADALCLSPRTVDTYRENIFLKTGAKNAVGVVIYAIQHNLLDIQALATS
jgi:DNA-binding NarL/FixJ family response regulator